VNRSLPVDAGGHGRDPFLPQQRLDLAAILAAYTSGSARVNGLDAVTGSIREGLDADFAVIDADLSHIGDHEICRAAVTATWVRGQLVYQQ
jgi:predicted amidohydrolase YtcJ